MVVLEFQIFLKVKWAHIQITVGYFSTSQKSSPVLRIFNIFDIFVEVICAPNECFCIICEDECTQK